jgi:hypothetical protein
MVGEGDGESFRALGFTPVNLLTMVIKDFQYFPLFSHCSYYSPMLG